MASRPRYPQGYNGVTYILGLTNIVSKQDLYNADTSWHACMDGGNLTRYHFKRKAMELMAAEWWGVSLLQDQTSYRWFNPKWSALFMFTCEQHEFICACMFVHACMVCKTITIKEVINLWGGGGAQELVEGEVMQTQHLSWKLSEKCKNWKYFAEIDILHSPLRWLTATLPPPFHN